MSNFYILFDLFCYSSYSNNNKPVENCIKKSKNNINKNDDCFDKTYLLNFLYLETLFIESIVFIFLFLRINKEFLIMQKLTIFA